MVVPLPNAGINTFNPHFHVRGGDGVVFRVDGNDGGRSLR